MKQKYIIALILWVISIAGCKQETCTVSCGGGDVYYVAIGFTRAELNGAISIFYRSKSFNSPAFSDTMLSANWVYPSPNDTTSDTLICGAMALNDGNINNLELVIPATNETYKIAGFACSGNITEELPCIEGGTPSGNPVGPACNGHPYLNSYVINGTMVTIPRTSNPADTFGYIYFNK